MKTLVTFTYGVSLEHWYKLGIIFRELELYKRLSRKKIKFYLLTYGDQGDLNFSDILGKIKVIPILNYIKSKSSISQFLKSLLLPFRMKKFFKTIDLIKTNQMDGSLFACICKLLYRKKLIIRCGWEWLRTYISDYKIKNKKRSYKTTFKYYFIYLIELISYKLANGIILTNEYDIKFIIDKFRLSKKEKKIKLLYNFIDVDLFKPLESVKKDKSVLYIGRLTYEKNLINAIKAFKDLNDFNLDIIGEGPLERKLRKISKDFGCNINFLGVLPNYKLPEIINHYQIFILPSYYEGNPKSLLEAMSCGIACIGTDVLGIKNIIKHKENGYLCKKDPNSIREAILEVYHNKELRNKIGTNARIYIENNFSLDILSKKELLFYKEILKN